MSSVKCAYHKCDETFVPVRYDQKYHDKKCKKRDFREKNPDSKKVYIGTCKICNAQMENVGRNPGEYCYDCRVEIRQATNEMYGEDDGEELEFSNDCSNCKFGKKNADADYGYECLARKAFECKPYFLQQPKFWEAK